MLAYHLIWKSVWKDYIEKIDSFMENKFLSMWL